MKKEIRLGIADYLVERRKIKSDFFDQIDILIDWRPISNLINKHYSKGAGNLRSSQLFRSYFIQDESSSDLVWFKRL